uniref:Transposase Tc1-like domain-containing protein n=1 Tax=Oncorhynchus mykiss TaxID=8022 RepID=A0A8C7UQN1_ONCMY
MGETSRRTITSAALHQSGLYGRVARQKPLLSKRHTIARLEFAKRHLKTLRPRETRFTGLMKPRLNSGLNAKCHVWRKPGTIPTVKHGDSIMGGGSIMQGLRLGLLILLCCLALFPAPVQGDKVLVMPVDGSHWLSMKLLVKELAARSHEMVVLVPDTSILIQGSDYYRTETFRVPYSKAQLDENVNKLKDAAFLKAPDVMDIFVNVQHLVHFTTMQVKGCEGLLYDEPLMQQLRGEILQLMLTDPFLPCGSIIADSFNSPAVYFSRGIPCGLDEKAAQCPTPPSYVPRFHSGNTDHMDFLGRVKNMLMYSLESYLCTVMFASFDELTSRYLEKDMTYRELLGHGAIWLLRYDYSFEYPKPRMPNMVNIGGINCGKIAPLPAVSLIRVCFRTNNFNCGKIAPLPAVSLIRVCFRTNNFNCGKIAPLPAVSLIRVCFRTNNFNCGKIAPLPAVSLIRVCFRTNNINCGKIAPLPAVSLIRVCFRTNNFNCGKRAPLPAVSLIRVCFRTNNFNCGKRAPLPAVSLIRVCFRTNNFNCGKRAPLPAVSLIRVCFRTNNFNCGTIAPLPAVSLIRVCFRTNNFNCGKRAPLPAVSLIRVCFKTNNFICA